MKKAIKLAFCSLGIITLIGVGTVIGINYNKNKSNKNNNESIVEDDIKYNIYLKAVDAGYTGTYDEWLNSIKGDEVELRVSDGYVQMKYKKETNWANIISLDSLKGNNGKEVEFRVSIIFKFCTKKSVKNCTSYIFFLSKTSALSLSL